MKQFFINLPNSWWGITIITALCLIVWLALSTLLYKQFFKRFYDILFSIIALPFFLVVYLFVAIAIKIEDKGNIFYCGERIGKDGKIFKMIKFRSMKENSPDIRLEDGSTYNAGDDDRVTKIGKILRKTSLDEIPQILNILIGQMSFLGPRPDPTDWLEKYSEEDKEFLKVRPGITGYNQAYFRNNADGEQKIKNDIYYVKKCSLFFDIKIAFKTIAVIFLRKNIYVSEDRLN